MWFNFLWMEFNFFGTITFWFISLVPIIRLQRSMINFNCVRFQISSSRFHQVDVIRLMSSRWFHRSSTFHLENKYKHNTCTYTGYFALYHLIVAIKTGYFWLIAILSHHEVCIISVIAPVDVRLTTPLGGSEIQIVKQIMDKIWQNEWVEIIPMNVKYK